MRSCQWLSTERSTEPFNMLTVKIANVCSFFFWINIDTSHRFWIDSTCLFLLLNECIQDKITRKINLTRAEPLWSSWRRLLSLPNAQVHFWRPGQKGYISPTFLGPGRNLLQTKFLVLRPGGQLSSGQDQVQNSTETAVWTYWTKNNGGRLSDVWTY